MTDRPTEPPDSPEDNQPDTIATPEGDNEAPPDAPLEPVSDDLETPPAIDTNKL